MARRLPAALESGEALLRGLLVRIGVGRDAAEVAFSTPFGTFEPKGMEVRITASGGGADRRPRTVDAISTDDAVNFGDG